MTIAHELPLWQTDPDWRDNRIASTARGAMFVRWLFAVAFIGISVPLVLVLPEELADGNWPALIAVLFPLVGVGMLYSAIVRTLEWRRVVPHLATGAVKSRPASRWRAACERRR